MNFWFKVFIFILAGFILRQQKVISKNAIKVFINAAIYFIIPFFILTASWGNTSSPAEMVKIGLVAAGVILAGAVYALLFIKLMSRSGQKIPFRNVCLSLMFMNSAYLAIPVNTYYFGNDGTTFAVIYNIVVTILISTLGIWLIGKHGFTEIFKIPFIYAATLGLILNFTKVSQPEWIVTSNNVIKTYALPAMLILVGYQINLTNFLAVRLAISGAAFRMVGGFVAGILLANLLGLKGVPLYVVAITSSMPPAINTYILAEKYSTDPEFAATAIFIGTLASFFIIPMVLEIVRR